MTVELNSGDGNHIDFYVSFVPFTENCSKSLCYYGWIDNYTFANSPSIQGYPHGDLTSSETPIF